MNFFRQIFSTLLMCVVGIGVGTASACVPFFPLVECEAFDLEECEEAVRQETQCFRAVKRQNADSPSRQSLRKPGLMQFSISARLRAEHFARNGFGGPMTS